MEECPRTVSACHVLSASISLPIFKTTPGNYLLEEDPTPPLVLEAPGASMAPELPSLLAQTAQAMPLFMLIIPSDPHT